jgi:cyclophilin family peptidyl-prolyl cis-trans isomerase
MKKTMFFTFILAFVAAGFWSFKNAENSAKANEKKVCISTMYGDIKIKLYDETPLHRDNFIKLAELKYFDGCLFHRIIKQFMIQGGDPDSKTADSTAILGNGGPAYTIPAEILPKYFHKKGALGAARDNNPAKASSGSQFYIVQGRKFTAAELDNLSKQTGKTFTQEQRDVYSTIGGTPHLDGDYTVFGEVYEGLNIVDSIANVKTGMYDRPKKDVKMTIKVIE